MIKAVLLDLDNTLLANPDNVFAPAYLHLAEQYFGQAWSVDGFSQVLLSTMRAMNTQHDMQQTNLQVAIRVIQQATGRSTEEVQRVSHLFYADAYTRLKDCTQPIAGAEALVNDLRGAGLAVVIATNPIYPPEAIQQRLSWAGLPNEFSAYNFVTHAGNMHFTKPDPAYYAEILARIGVEPDEALMVGDSLVNDIVPARQVGLRTFHIPFAEDRADLSEDSKSLADLRQFIRTPGWQDSFAPQLLSAEGIIPQLRGNVGALFGMIDGIKLHYWMQHPDPNEWSILQIVCHLFESEETVQRLRLQQILALENPFLAESRQPPGPEAAPCSEDGEQAVRAFVNARLQTIAFLNALQPGDWDRPARHSVFGPTTLLEMAQFTAQHDRLHLNQLCQTLGSCK